MGGGNPAQASCTKTVRWPVCNPIRGCCRRGSLPLARAARRRSAIGHGRHNPGRTASCTKTVPSGSASVLGRRARQRRASRQPPFAAGGRASPSARELDLDPALSFAGAVASGRYNAVVRDSFTVHFDVRARPVPARPTARCSACSGDGPRTSGKVPDRTSLRPHAHTSRR